MTKRVNVSLTDEQVEMLREFNGIMGNNDSEIIRNILITWFKDQGLIAKYYEKNKEKKQKQDKCFLSKLK